MKLEKSIIIDSCVIFLLIITILTGCKKTDKSDSVLPSGNMTEVLGSSTAYWASNVALQRGGYAQQLTTTGPFTGFVVSNYGWRIMGYSIFAGVNQTTGSTDTLSRINPLIMKAVSGYMFSLGKLDTAGLPNTINGEIKTIDGKTLYCSKILTKFNFNDVTKIVNVPYINGHPITTINIPYPNNGIIHELGELILPPIGTVAASIDTIVLRKDSTLTFLKAAFEKASTATGSGSLNLNEILSSSGPYTLFAPTNVAFRNYPGKIYGSLAKINALSGAALDLLNRNLQFHIVPQRMFTSFWIGFPTTQTPTNSFATLLNGKSIFIYGNSSIVGNNVRAFVSGGVDANRTCTNGVIHKIGVVLRSQ
jgi:uncharacterized surface protein with fasciclin (FAS1) repeats